MASEATRSFWRHVGQVYVAGVLFFVFQKVINSVLTPLENAIGLRRA